MNRRSLVTFALLLSAGPVVLHPQSYPQNPSDSDSLFGQQGSQNPSAVCPDGSTTSSLGDGGVECVPSRQQQQSPGQSSGVDNRPNSVAGAAENADISGQPKTKKQ